MSRRSKILLVLVIILVILLAVWLYFWLQNNNTNVNTNINQPAVSTNTPTINTPTGVVEPIPKLTDTTLSARVLALNFAERYGTYSNDMPYENLKNLTGILTPSFQTRVNSIIKSGTKPAGFYSVTTKALVAKVDRQTDSAAELTISTQRQEVFTRDGEVKISYATLRVSLSKSGENWLVDSASWESE
jgi:hypothetical protein